MDAYRKLIAGNPKFSVFTSADVIKQAIQVDDGALTPWIDWYKDLYNVECNLDD